MRNAVVLSLSLAWISIASAQQVGQTCVVADPTTSELNLRARPRGKLLSTIPNGQRVTIREVRNDDRAFPWARLRSPNGWVLASFLNCSTAASEPTPPQETKATVSPPLVRTEKTVLPDHYDAQRAWDFGAKEAAIVLWIASSDRGDGRAALAIGSIYLEDAEFKNEVMAYYYLLLAQKNGFADVPRIAKAKSALPAETVADIDGAVLEWKPRTEASARTEELTRLAKATNAQGRTLLMTAAASNNRELVDSLLEVGAEAGTTDKSGYSALHYAIINRATDVITSLARREALIVTTPSGALPSELILSMGLPLDPGVVKVTREQVLRIQGFLSKGGFLQKAPDGAFDGATRKALREFQRSAELPDSGSIDDWTLLALNRAGPNLPPPYRVVVERIKFGDVLGPSYETLTFEMSGSPPGQVKIEAERACERAAPEAKCHAIRALPSGMCISEYKIDKSYYHSSLYRGGAAAQSAGSRECLRDTGGECQYLSSFC